MGESSTTAPIHVPEPTSRKVRGRKHQLVVPIADDPRKILYFAYALSTFLLFATSYISWNYYDVQWWLIWCKIAERYGILSIYALSPKLAYFPLFPLTFIAFYKLAQLLHVANNINLLRIVEKIPIVVATIVGGELIWRETRSLEATCLWLLGIPTLELFWGYQYDSIVGVLLLLHVKYLRDRDWTRAGICLGLATLYKQAVVLAGAVGLKIVKDYRSMIRYLTATFLTVLAVSLPFLLYDPRAFIGKTLLFHGERLPQEVSIWNIPQLLTSHLMPNIRHLWILPTLAVLVLLVARYRICDDYLPDLAKYQALLLGVLILLNKIGNPPYFLWIYPSIVLWLGARRHFKKSIVLPLLALSVTGFVLHPLLVYFPRVVLDKPLLIVEDVADWNAYWLYLHSYQGLALYFAQIVVNTFRTVPQLRSFVQFLYTNFNILDSILALTYNISLAVLLYYMAKM